MDRRLHGRIEGCVVALVAGVVGLSAASRLGARRSHDDPTPAPLQAERPIELRPVPDPSDPSSALVPLDLPAERTVRELASALRGLLAFDERSLVGADVEFAEYARRVLLPRVEAPWLALHADEVFDLEPSGGRSCLPAATAIVGTWRDTFYFHDLRFVAVATRDHVDRRPRAALLVRLSGLVDSFGAHDLDGDGREEVVVVERGLGSSPTWRLRVFGTCGAAWSSHVLASEVPPAILASGARTSARARVVQDGRARGYTWSASGFAPASPDRRGGPDS